MSKQIIIFYEHIKREYEACLRLKNEIEKTEPEYKVYIYSIVFEFFKAIKTANKHGVDMVIMPWIYTDKDYELVQPFINKNPDVYVLNFHHEQIASEITEDVVLPSGEPAKNSVIHLVWGSFFKEKLLNVKVKSNLIFETGNIRTDNAFHTSISRKDLSDEFGLDINKKWILFSESRGWVLSNTGKRDKHLIELGFPETEIEERKSIAILSLKQTLKEFDELPDAFFKEVELIYRPHPGTEAPDNINRRVKVINKYSIYDWLNSIDVNVAWSSTTIFESDIKEIPSIVYEPIEHPQKFQAYGLEHYQKISRFDEINDEMLNYYRTNIAPKKIYAQYIGRVDGKSVERTKEVIIHILKDGIEGYKAQRTRFGKKRYLKMYFFDKVSKVIIKLGLLEIFKYPNTAYQLRKDIPSSMK